MLNREQAAPRSGSPSRAEATKDLIKLEGTNISNINDTVLDRTYSTNDTVLDNVSGRKQRRKGNALWTIPLAAMDALKGLKMKNKELKKERGELKEQVVRLQQYTDREEMVSTIMQKVQKLKKVEIVHNVSNSEPRRMESEKSRTNHSRG